jgi:hypothetical protein
MDELERWQEGNNAYLGAAFTWLRLRLARLANPRRSSAPPRESAPPEGLPAPRSTPPRESTPPGFELTEAELVMTDAQRIEPPPALTQIRKRFGLSAFEEQILLLCVAMELDTSIGELCALAQKEARQPFPSFALSLALFDDPAWEALSPERPLRYFKLVELGAGETTRPLVNQPLRVDERIINAVKGLQYVDERLSPLLQALLPADQAPLPPSQAAIATTAISNLRGSSKQRRLPVLQLVGTDGTSKRAVAIRIATELGLSLFRLPVDLLPTQPAELDALARLWERESLLLPLALYVDALDLERVSPTEGAGPLVLRLLGRLRGLCLLDARDPFPGVGAPSCPGLSFDVKKPTALEQRMAWGACYVDAEESEGPALLASQFNLAIGEIASIAGAVPGELSGEELTPRLWRECLVRTRPRLDQLAQRLDAKATWEDIVLPDQEVRQLRQIAAQVRERSRVYDDWGFRARMNRGLGISALFAGDSGTGKTMAAEVIANECRLDLYRIDLSAVVSKYIGETEKNLRRMFDAAEDGGAILFFDEADALFGKRSEVKDSHDRYANIEVNYLLQRMEAYGGLAILATNMKSALDLAFMRRLRFVVNFPVPGSAERKRMWRRAFPAQVALGELDFDHLARLNLTGGSIANVALHAAFLAAEADALVGMPLVLEAARVEFKKLERPVSEAEFTVRPRTPLRTHA